MPFEARFTMNAICPYCGSLSRSEVEVANIHPSRKVKRCGTCVRFYTVQAERAYPHEDPTKADAHPARMVRYE